MVHPLPKLTAYCHDGTRSLRKTAPEEYMFRFGTAASTVKIEEIVRTSANKSLIYRSQVPYEDNEMALAFAAFVAWLAASAQLSNPEMHFRAANASGREFSLLAITYACQEASVTAEFNRAFPKFNVEEEIAMAGQRILKDSPSWASWEYSLTRSVILIVRFLAYDVCETVGLMPTLVDPDGSLMSNIDSKTPAELGELARLWLRRSGLPITAEHFGKLSHVYSQRTIGAILLGVRS
jgi:hypothetical protein